MSPDEKVVDLPIGHPGHAGGANGNGVLTRYRLDELDRRVAEIEKNLTLLVTTCSTIESKLDQLASKSYVARVFGATLFAIIVSLVAHLLIRILATP